MRYILSLVVLLSGAISAMGATVQFTANDVCEGSQTTFISNSQPDSGTIVQFLWDFDNDGEFDDGSGNSVTNLFSNAGTYQVGLKIITNYNDSDSTYQSVVINPIATANFFAPEVCEGNATSFTDNSSIASGSIVTYEWDFDNDGFYDDATGATVSNEFPSYGTFPAGLRVTSDSGCVSIVSKNVTVNPNPTVDFTFTEVCIGDTTSLNGTSSVATGTVDTYEWELNGDNQFNDSTGQSINHEFINWGNHLVGLKVTTNKGCSAQFSQVVTVAPIPYITFEFDSSCVGLSVGFNNQSFSPVGTMTYEWDFGDGGSSTNEDANYTFQSAGTFDVTLTGTSNYGCVDSATETINIYPRPEADFDFNNVCFGETTIFENTAKPLGSTIESYYWNLDDGTETFVTNPTHQYNTADSFDVSLVVYSTDGCIDTVTQTVHVWELPDANIVADGPLDFCIGEDVTLSLNPSPENDENVLWSTADDGNSITVDEEDSYHVLIYDEHNCKDRDTVDVVVYPLPTLEVSNDTSISLGFDVPLEVNGAEMYDWSPMDYLDDPMSDMPTSTPMETITYTVTGTDENGCVNSTEVTIEVIADYNFVTYNLFSPNGDNVNDYFEIKNIELYDDCNVVVYNRLGSKVFEADGYTNDWDGTYEGKELPNATYYYVITCEGTEKVYDGPISILR